MSSDPSSVSPESIALAAKGLKPSPYLHVGADRIYDPMTDRILHEGDPGYAALRSWVQFQGVVAPLAADELDLLTRDRWLIEKDADLSRNFLLKFVALEAHTICNQSCYFCPVSIAPREEHFMPTEQYEDIIRQLSAYRDTIEAVFMISYNEPTVDRRFVDQIRTIKAAGLPPGTHTNGTGLTPERVDQIIELGGMRFLSVNISSQDREKYRRDRGADHLDLVLRNLEYARDLEVAEHMDISVLGTGDEVHRQEFERMKERFADSRFEINSHVVNDRAQYLQIGVSGDHSGRKLNGCDLFGSRPLQHLHITPHGKCILCCQDYSETAEVGDLNEMSVHEVLTGPKMVQMRRWVYGLDRAPRGFICYQCKFALSWTDESNPEKVANPKNSESDVAFGKG